MTKAGRVLGVTLVFGLMAGAAYWLFLYVSTGEAPSFSDLWGAASGGFQTVTGIGKLSFSDLSGFASNAGFQGDDVNTAAAIALAESSGNPNAVGDLNITPGGSIGLWQINLKAHPEYSANTLKDPQTNANAAYAVYSAAGGFGPWSTFNSGAYQKYLPAAAPAASPDASADATVNASNGSAAYGQDADGTDTIGGSIGGA